MTLTLPGAGGTVNRSIVLPSLREGIDTSNATSSRVVYESDLISGTGVS